MKPAGPSLTAIFKMPRFGAWISGVAEAMGRRVIARSHDRILIALDLPKPVATGAKLTLEIPSGKPVQPGSILPSYKDRRPNTQSAIKCDRIGPAYHRHAAGKTRRACKSRFSWYLDGKSVANARDWMSDSMSQPALYPLNLSLQGAVM